MIRIPASIYNGLIEHAKGGFPLEVCGILGGSGDTVSIAYAMTNTDASNEHYMMDPREQFGVIKDLRSKGLSMQGIYHSHPESPARPSVEDIRLALTPGVSYMIISLLDRALPDVKSYRIENDTVLLEQIEIIPA
jgi:proteasome lid subunit RPN8/RPN11